MSLGNDSGAPKVSSDLSLVAPLFRDAVDRAIAECHRQGLDAFVFEAYRSQELQSLYYTRGRTQIPPLKTVTNAPTNLQSWHGFGLAVDVISKSKLWNAGDAWFEKVAAIFKANECKWGGDWTVPDPPHFQWHRCKASPSREAQDLLRLAGPEAVWQAVGASTPVVMPPAPSASPAEARKAMVTAMSLNLREDPSTTRPPITQLARGSALEVLGQQGSWCKVRADGKEGFVHADLIAFLDERKPAGFLKQISELQTVPLPVSRTIPLPVESVARMVATTWNSYGGLLGAVCKTLQIPPAGALAVLCAEANGSESADPPAMFGATQSDAREQIVGMFDHIKGGQTSSLMVQALQTKNYEAFATRYKGPGQAETYGKMLRNYATSFETLMRLQP